MNILLACAMGMSTSLVVNKMKEAAEAQNKNYKIWATDIDSLEDEEDSFDIVMIGPQVAWRIDEVEDAVDGKAPIVIIDKDIYGKCDGAAVIAQAEKVLGKG
ncbi:MAG: PTS sugar transporter subunit IIB [Longibaculum sp.]